MSAYHIKSWCCNFLYVLFFTFSTFASNKLESYPPANSGLFNLTSSPFEIQFSGQIQSKHSLRCFLSFDQICFGVWVQMFESAFIIIKKGQFYIKFAKIQFSSWVWVLSDTNCIHAKPNACFYYCDEHFFQIFVTKCIWAKNPIICPSQSSPFLLYDTQMHKMTWNIFL